MARKKRKNPPKSTERCLKKTGRGHRCRNARVRGEKYCGMHMPGRASELGKKGNAVKSARKKAREEAVERWQMASLTDAAEDLLLDIEGLEQDAGKMKATEFWNLRLAFKREFRATLEAREKYKQAGKQVFVLFKTVDGKQTDWPEAKGDRPTPTPFDGEEQGFNPPPTTDA